MCNSLSAGRTRCENSIINFVMLYSIKTGHFSGAVKKCSCVDLLKLGLMEMWIINLPNTLVLVLILSPSLHFQSWETPPTLSSDSETDVKPNRLVD